LPAHLKALYILKVGHKYLKFPRGENEYFWKDFQNEGEGTETPAVPFDMDRTSVILFSGGTTGKAKGICLTDYNINACALQAREAMEEEFREGFKMLSCMPIFHGFGLGINIHVVLTHGACCILMPTFNIKTYSEMLLKKKPNFIAGVPAIFDALLRMPNLEGQDLSFLRGMFCGGDSLTVELKRKIDAFLKEHNADIQVREGYGLTECVTASCLTPKDTYKEGSIGLPFPDTVYAIVRPGTDDVVPFGEEGEIILRGPSVMKGYLNDPEETAETLRVLKDGNTWLYTGDLGMMDEEGYVYFRQRIKRMIVTNGYNVYPSVLENALETCPEVSCGCVIGVKDERKGQRVRAYVVLNEGYKPTDRTKDSIMKQMKVKVAGYALPKEIIFREDLPKTLVGKVAYRILEEEAEKEQVI
ncbi:MAG: AMP-binding protein, partial [Firmicutes bacterium]|nr:AMP-binding protein [Bacillota bacterium]